MHGGVMYIARPQRHDDDRARRLRRHRRAGDGHPARRPGHPARASAPRAGRLARANRALELAGGAAIVASRARQRRNVRCAAPARLRADLAQPARASAGDGLPRPPPRPMGPPGLVPRTDSCCTRARGPASRLTPRWLEPPRERWAAPRPTRRPRRDRPLRRAAWRGPAGPRRGRTRCARRDWDTSYHDYPPRAAGATGSTRGRPRQAHAPALGSEAGAPTPAPSAAGGPVKANRAGPGGPGLRAERLRPRTRRDRRVHDRRPSRTRRGASPAPARGVPGSRLGARARRTAADPPGSSAHAHECPLRGALGCSTSGARNSTSSSRAASGRGGAREPSAPCRRATASSAC